MEGNLKISGVEEFALLENKSKSLVEATGRCHDYTPYSIILTDVTQQNWVDLGEMAPCPHLPPLAIHYQYVNYSRARNIQLSLFLTLLDGI